MQRLGRLAALLASDALLPLDRLPTSGMCLQSLNDAAGSCARHQRRAASNGQKTRSMIRYQYVPLTFSLHCAGVLSEPVQAAAQVRRSRKMPTTSRLSRRVLRGHLSRPIRIPLSCLLNCTGLEGHLSAAAAASVSAAAAAAAGRRMLARTAGAAGAAGTADTGADHISPPARLHHGEAASCHTAARHRLVRVWCSGPRRLQFAPALGTMTHTDRLRDTFD